MKLLVAVLGFFLLAACVTRTVERQTVVKEQPGAVTVVPGPQGPPGPPGPAGATGPSGDTTIIVPRQ